MSDSEHRTRGPTIVTAEAPAAAPPEAKADGPDRSAPATAVLSSQARDVTGTDGRVPSRDAGTGGSVMAEPKPSADRALILGALPDGEGVAVLRKRSADAPIEAGIVRPLREGQAIVGEVVKLTPRQNAESSEAPALCDVHVEFDGRPGSATGADGPNAGPLPRAHKGPARVASNSYRAGWDQVFGVPSAKKGTALN